MVLVGALPAEPKALVALAERKDDPDAATAAELLKQLKWPGKPGTSNARALTADEQQLFDKGKVQFATLCAACHQANGQGLAGLAPSLVYSRWVLGDPRVLARIVLCGKAQENMIMPPWKGALDDEAIASVLTFIRRSWGQEADPVTVATVTEARAATAKRDEPWSDQDLDALVRALNLPRQGHITLKFAVAAHDQGDWELRVVVEGEVIHRRSVTHDAPRWKEVSVDLARYAGRRVVVRLENAATDWLWEFGYWADLRLETGEKLQARAEASGER